MRRTAVAAALLVAGAVATWSAPAGADPEQPDRALTITADCGDGPFSVSVNGNGAWTPAHRTDSTAVFILVEFGGETITITPTGESPVVINEPGISKPRTAAPGGRDLLTCSFSFTEEVPGAIVTGVGTVTGWVANRG